jgi:ribosomal protein S18 acetylase RimI-like enzyme
MLKVAAMGERIPFEPPADSLYIDGLTTDPAFRRRGVARALLGAADERARALGLPAVALDTGESNTGARALYEGYGYEMVERTPQLGPIPPIVFYVRELG